MSERDPYLILGIERGATPDEIRAAFRRKVRQRHPDTAPEAEEGSDVQEVLSAYRTLIDAASGAPYDSRRHRPEPGARGHRIRVRHADSPGGVPTQPGAVRCGACDGAGVEQLRMVCPGCGGRAETTALDGRRARIVSCRDCGGRGQVTMRRRCEACSGSGGIPT